MSSLERQRKRGRPRKMEKMEPSSDVEEVIKGTILRLGATLNDQEARVACLSVVVAIESYAGIRGLQRMIAKKRKQLRCVENMLTGARKLNDLTGGAGSTDREISRLESAIGLLFRQIESYERQLEELKAKVLVNETGRQFARLFSAFLARVADCKYE